MFFFYNDWQSPSFYLSLFFSPNEGFIFQIKIKFWIMKYRLRLGFPLTLLTCRFAWLLLNLLIVRFWIRRDKLLFFLFFLFLFFLSILLLFSFFIPHTVLFYPLFIIYELFLTFLLLFSLQQVPTCILPLTRIHSLIFFQSLLKILNK